jgi:hypothetical protein
MTQDYEHARYATLEQVVTHELLQQVHDWNVRNFCVLTISQAMGGGCREFIVAVDYDDYEASS